MKKRLMASLLVLFVFSNIVFAADEDKKAQPVDIKALAQRFDAEAKPFFTVEKSTTFIRIDGGVTYLPANSLVPVLDGIMKVNGSFCNKSKPDLIEAAQFVEKTMKDSDAAAAELNELKTKVDDAKSNVETIEEDMKILDRRLADLKSNNKNANTQQLGLELGRKRNELTDARRDLKRLEKDFDKKKDIPEDLKKKAMLVKAAFETFLATQKKLADAAKPDGKTEDKKTDDKKAPAHNDDIPAPKFK